MLVLGASVIAPLLGVICEWKWRSINCNTQVVNRVGLPLKLGHNSMLHVGPSFVMYALLRDQGCCPRAHFEVDGHEPEAGKESSIDCNL